MPSIVTVSDLHHVVGPVCALCDSKLKDAHPDLVKWFHDVVKATFPHAHISWAYRGPKDQAEAFKNGRSNAQFPHSPHNKTPALALDLFVLSDEGIATFPYKFYARVFELTRFSGLSMRWGANFKSLSEANHFELG